MRDGMVDREKVVEMLQEAAAYFRSSFDAMYGTVACEMFRNWTDAIEQAIAMLKAREPRVMTLEEVKQYNHQNGCVWFEQPTYNAVAAFVIKEDFMIQVISPYILGEPINHGYWTNNNYGKTWRCWTSRPTDAQREAAPWE